MRKPRTMASAAGLLLLLAVACSPSGSPTPIPTIVLSQNPSGAKTGVTASVKAPLAGLDLSSGARAGLTAFLAGVARTVADKNVTINNMLPGAFDTDRLRSTLSKTAEQKGRSVMQVVAERINSIPARRFGDPVEFGAACAFLCSAHAGYITGQNLLIDGGTFNGAF